MSLGMRRMLTLCTAIAFLLLAVVTLLRLSTPVMGSFDGQMLGYGLDQAQAYLAALSEGQRAFYLGAFRVADTLFPAMLALTLLMWWLQITQGAMRAGLIAATGLYLLADYAENMYVARLVEAGSDGISRQMVETASMYTQIKWLALLICLGASVILWWGKGRKV